MENIDFIVRDNTAADSILHLLYDEGQHMGTAATMTNIEGDKLQVWYCADYDCLMVHPFGSELMRRDLEKFIGDYCIWTVHTEYPINHEIPCGDGVFA